MSMREKIADRLMQHYAEGGPWDGFMEADIVLDALIEPTIGMVSEGQDAVYNGEASPGPVHIPMTTGSFSVIFQAMIRAAKEGK